MGLVQDLRVLAVAYSRTLDELADVCRLLGEDEEAEDAAPVGEDTPETLGGRARSLVSREQVLNQLERREGARHDPDAWSILYDDQSNLIAAMAATA